MKPQDVLASLSGVTKRFGPVTALESLDLEVRAGELLAVLGPNGAGKTTAIHLLLGLQRPDGGSVHLFGRPPGRVEARRRIGVMMQEVTLASELRVREHLELTSGYYPDPLPVDRVLKTAGLEDLGRRLYGRLSAGQKRRVQFAMAVCGRPSLLFLDEPTVGLDIQSREMVWASMRDLVDDGCSVVLTTHYLEEAEALADRVIVLNKGRVAAHGSVQDMRSLVVRTRIRCSTTLPVEEVRSWPGVGSAARDAGRLEITSTNPEAVVRRLLAADDDLQDLEVERAGLAEAFTKLTEEAAA